MIKHPGLSLGELSVPDAPVSDLRHGDLTAMFFHIFQFFSFPALQSAADNILCDPLKVTHRPGSYLNAVHDEYLLALNVDSKQIRSRVLLEKIQQEVCIGSVSLVYDQLWGICVQVFFGFSIDGIPMDQVFQ